MAYLKYRGKLLIPHYLAGTGMLRPAIDFYAGHLVRSWPSGGGWRLAGSGGEWLPQASGMRDLPFGRYEIEFNAVDGYVAPPPIAVHHNQAVTIFEARYEQIGAWLPTPDEDVKRMIVQDPGPGRLPVVPPDYPGDGPIDSVPVADLPQPAEEYGDKWPSEYCDGAAFQVSRLVTVNSYRRVYAPRWEDNNVFNIDTVYSDWGAQGCYYAQDGAYTNGGTGWVFRNTVSEFRPWMYTEDDGWLRTAIDMAGEHLLVDTRALADFRSAMATGSMDLLWWGSYGSHRVPEGGPYCPEAASAAPVHHPSTTALVIADAVVPVGRRVPDDIAGEVWERVDRVSIMYYTKVPTMFYADVERTRLVETIYDWDGSDQGMHPATFELGYDEYRLSVRSVVLRRQ